MSIFLAFLSPGAIVQSRSFGVLSGNSSDPMMSAMVRESESFLSLRDPNAIAQLESFGTIAAIARCCSSVLEVGDFTVIYLA